MSGKLFHALLFTVLMVCDCRPNYDVKLSQMYFDGGFLFFRVKREKVQQRLGEINCQFDNDDVKLYLPSQPVLQDVLASDEHLVMIVFGTDKAVTFDAALSNTEKETESVFMEGLGISIPYLTSKNGSSQRMTVQTKLFISECGHHIDTNVRLSAPVVADRFERNVNETTVDIQLEKDDFLLHLIGKYNESCSPACDHDIEVLQEYKSELQVTQSGPDFSICDRLPDIQVDFCDVYRNPKYNAVLKKAGNNVCQYWEPTDDVRNSSITFQVASMSKTMEKFLLLEEGQDVLGARIVSGTFDVRLVFPCFE